MKNLISIFILFIILSTLSVLQTTAGNALALDGMDTFANNTHSVLLCPVEPPSNPNPPDNECNVPLTGNVATWDNGLGTTQIELWFGELGNLLTKLYDGTAITSFVLPTLNERTTYNWFVICKNDTCGTQGPLWSFVTEQGWGFEDEFNNFCYWTIVGPLGLENWEIRNSNYAGGTAPELSLNWYPHFNGISKIRSVEFPLPVYSTCCEISFDFFFYWFANPSGTITVGITIDSGATSSIIYSLSNPTGNIGPLHFSTAFGTLSMQNAQLEITYTGYSYNFNFIYWDNFESGFWEPYCPPGAPGNLTVQINNMNVQLDWQDYSGNEDGFKIYRKNGYLNDPGNYDHIGTVDQNQIQFIDTNVFPESTYTYKVSAFNFWGENESVPATITLPIPVELTSFGCEVAGNIVTLFWHTATETNNSGFEILRTAQNESENWERIGFVEGKGTTIEPQSYSFLDEPKPGKYRYRLKQIDFNGSYEYSKEVEAEVLAPLEFSLEQNFPNPFNPITVIKYSIPKVSKIELKVFDILGKVVATLVSGEKTFGSYEVEFAATNLTSGIYFYQLKAGSFIETKKMMLMK